MQNWFFIHSNSIEKVPIEGCLMLFILALCVLSSNLSMVNRLGELKLSLSWNTSRVTFRRVHILCYKLSVQVSISKTFYIFHLPTSFRSPLKMSFLHFSIIHKIVIDKKSYRFDQHENPSLWNKFPMTNEIYWFVTNLGSWRHSGYMSNIEHRATKISHQCAIHTTSSCCNIVIYIRHK